MIKKLLFLSIFVSSVAFAKGPVLWGPNQTSLSLQSNLKFLSNGPGVYQGSANPTVVAVNANTGSIYLDTSNGNLYVKQDNGSTTNWVNALSAASGWALVGNAGTNPAVNFIGTTDNKDVVLKSNNTEKFRLVSGGSLSATADINPSASATYNLGSNALKWNDMWSAGTIHPNSVLGGTYSGAAINVGAAGNSYFQMSSNRFLEIDLGGTMTTDTLLQFSSQGNGRTITFQDGSYNVIGDTLTQNISNKTFTNPITFTQVSTPVINPAAGKDDLYFKADNHLYSLTSTGAETRIDQTGTVTSVGLSLPAEFTVSNTPVTTAGTLTAVWAAGSAPFVSKTLSDAFVIVGNSSNVATPVTMSGEATINDVGALSLTATGVVAGSYTNTSLTVDSHGRITSASSGAAGGGGGGAYFSLENASVKYTHFGQHVQTSVQSLTSVNMGLSNNDTNSASITVRINQYRAGALFSTANAAITVAASTFGTSVASALSKTLSLASGDLITADVISVTGAPEWLTVEY